MTDETNTVAPVTSSIFQSVETEVVADFDAAVSDVEQFFTADVWPIIKATLQYIETNGGADLLEIASNALNAAVSSIETGTEPEAVAASVIGTVVDEAKSAGIEIAQGAATLAVSMAAAQINQATKA